MKNISDIVTDGFSLRDISPEQSNLAAQSLKSAFLSYFRTSDIQYRLLSEEHRISGMAQSEIDELYTGNYALDACDSITHFQHFLELFLKDILVEDSPLLVVDAKDKHEILYNLIHSNTVSESDYETLKFIEFSDAEKRVKALLGNFDPKYSFLSSYYNMMERINTLRNRIAHRGAFILRPDALDELFGGYILPFIKDLEDNVEKFRSTLKIGFNLHTPSIDPFTLIRQEYASGHSVNKKKILVLKLIGLSAYQNDIPYIQPSSNPSDPFDSQFWIQSLYEDKKRKIEKSAFETANWGRIEKCPVCGCESFCLEYDSYDADDGEIAYVYDGNCTHCGFKLKDNLLDPSINGLPLQNFTSL